MLHAIDPVQASAGSGVVVPVSRGRLRARPDLRPPEQA
jgi:hypothetical protein